MRILHPEAEDTYAVLTFPRHASSPRKQPNRTTKEKPHKTQKSRP